MSLLLQALKKAEEEKRRREALAQEALTQEPMVTPSESPLAVVANSASADVAAGDDRVDESAQVLPPEAWVFDPLPDPAPAPEPTSNSQVQSDALFEPAPPAMALSLADVEPLPVEPTSAPTASSREVLASPPLAHGSESAMAPARDDVSAGAIVEPPQAASPPQNGRVPLATSAASQDDPERETQTKGQFPAQSIASPAQRLAANQIFQLGAKKRMGKGLLPWIALGGAVLLFGLISWFAWQYQQLTNPSLAPLPAALPKEPVASQPQDTATPLEVELGHAPVAEYPVEVKSNKAVHEDTVQGMSQIKAPRGQTEQAPGSRTSISPKENSTSSSKVKFEKTTLDTQAPLQQAWQAYQQDDIALAERLYSKVLASEPRNRDALLGLAAVQVRRGQTAQAAGVYQYLLQLNPQDQAVLQAQMALNPEAISDSSEARLLQDASQSKNPLLLGQFYASRQRWQEAQEQFFQAWSMHPDNADLAYNLAVSLDHLKQPRLAADYYRKALDLASKRASSFDRAAAEARLAQLRLAGE